MEKALTIPGVADPLRLTACPRCGHSLEGLPDEGICPECGRPYDQATVVVQGYARGEHARVENAPPWIAALLVVFFLGLTWFYLSTRNTIFLLWSGFLMLGFAASLWRRWTNPLPGLVQVRLSGAGCCQVDSRYAALDVAETPWSSLRRLEITERRGRRARLRFELKTPWWWLGRTFPVDADVDCTPAQAATLRTRIADWRRES
jgi:hypothetical protein